VLADVDVHGFAGAVFAIAIVVATAQVLTGRWGALLSTIVIAILAGALWEATYGEP
jgi:hypothetical protein